MEKDFLKNKVDCLIFFACKPFRTRIPCDLRNIYNIVFVVSFTETNPKKTCLICMW